MQSCREGELEGGACRLQALGGEALEAGVGDIWTTTWTTTVKVTTVVTAASLHSRGMRSRVTQIQAILESSSTLMSYIKV